MACSSDKAEVVDLYDIDMGEEIVVLPSAELKIPKNLDILPEPTPGGENLTDPVKK
tara:strand:- start:973 stop:1140 length:168 start_codon:yes stop_codon:yes gene_type:complete